MDSNEHHPDSRTLADYFGLVARGFAMGASNIVPGVSGGTMALIMGIYEELISSIKAVLNRDAIKLALRFKIGQALNLIPWKFLASVAAGVFLATFTMSFFLEWVLEHYSSLLWAFFFGLVAASIYTVSKQVKKWGVAPVIGIVVGAVGAYLLVGVVPMETPDTWWLYFLGGGLAMGAMVLPGVSGSFILVLIGKYEAILSAVTNGDFFVLLMVIAGAAIGVVSIAQVLSWLFKTYHDGTVAVLTGMLIGSLRKVWPWKDAIGTNVLPATWTLNEIMVVVFALLGFALILGLTILASRGEHNEA